MVERMFTTGLGLSLASSAFEAKWISTGVKRRRNVAPKSASIAYHKDLQRIACGRPLT